ncbi:hypothetical protein JVT61DRAFT_8866 [Boletus reticuloceps]|uniref:F-box domain-containing protein n=1 Tax=Boletus reticuloceps TaxID=495285 RepID=A0A8I2YGY3_9AGAM|nr:hypothetical protein JVT61DRAFT_8866 [Boletus reticuloceps]
MSSETSSRNPLLIAELFYAVLHYLVDTTWDTTPEPSPNGVDIPYSVGTNGIPIRAYDPDTRRTLAALARTCRAFTCPALDLLWRRLHSLEPLLWCFTSREAIFSTRQPLRPPSPADWVVIRHYACRIQYLEVHDVLALSSFFLGCVPFDTNLFPNLKVLKWNTRSHIIPIDIKFMYPLLGPNLVVLDITTHKDDTTLPSLLKALPSRCPAVTTARFGLMRRENLALMDIFTRAICSFKNLKSLIIDAFVDNRVLQDVTRSTQLQELCLGLQLYQPENQPPSEISLCNLRRLVLLVPELDQLNELLRPGHQSFCGIMLRLLRVEFATLIGSLFVGLAMYSRKSTLNVLHLRSTRPHFDLLNIEQLPFILSFDTFRPLTCHTNLRELIIKLANPISLNDAELVDLVRNWPLLQVLELCYFFPLPIRARRTTFNGLLSLVPVCPELRHVGLTLDGTEIPDGAPVGLVSKTITALRFYNTPIYKRTRQVAKFLLTHFPSVTSVTGPPGAIQMDSHGRAWAQVEAYMVGPSEEELGVDNSGDAS